MYKLLNWFDNLVARFRMRNWKPSDNHCEMCAELPDRLIAHNTGDGWLFSWECPNYCGWEENFIYEWPFIRPSVWGHDLESVGFEVV